MDNRHMHLVHAALETPMRWHVERAEWAALRGHPHYMGSRHRWSEAEWLHTAALHLERASAFADALRLVGRSELYVGTRIYDEVHASLYAQVAAHCEALGYSIDTIGEAAREGRHIDTEKHASRFD